MLWYAVQTKPKREDLAYRHLTAQGFEVFYPKFQSMSGRLGPLFTGYLFARLDISTGAWNKIRNTFGCRSIVTMADDPVPVPSNVIERIMRLYGEVLVERPGPIFHVRVGDEVQVEGLDGVVGCLASLDSKGRVRVLLRMLGGDREVYTHTSRLIAA